MAKNRKNLIFMIIFLVISFTSGILSNDWLIGSLVLFTGLTGAYLASEGKRINYIFSFINIFLTGYVAYKNQFYGIAICSWFILSPIEILSFVVWNKNKNSNNELVVREFTIKNSIIVIISFAIASCAVGALLNLIPNQNFAFIDATANCLHVSSLILMMMRFKEAWWLSLIDNIIDLTIWILAFINHGESAMMMLIMSVAFLAINIGGIIKWQTMAKKQKE